MCLTRLQNRSLFWHPELSPFLSSVSLLVIIALTLNVREINQNDFFKVNGCKESKRGGKISHAFSMSSMHERQGRAEMQSTDALIYSCYPRSAAAKPERWQRGQGHELGILAHLCQLIGFPQVSKKCLVIDIVDGKSSSNSEEDWLVSA